MYQTQSTSQQTTVIPVQKQCHLVKGRRIVTSALNLRYFEQRTEIQYAV
jgi:hypothetical protein